MPKLSKLPKMKEGFRLNFFPGLSGLDLLYFKFNHSSSFEIILAADAKWWERLAAAFKFGIGSF